MTNDLETPTSVAGRRLPEPGSYLVPARRGDRPVLRGWDGEVWLGTSSPAPDGATLPGYRRRPLGWLQNGNWMLLAGFVVATGAAGALWAKDRDARWVKGIQLPVPLLAVAATTIVMVALMRFLNRRIGFDRIPARTRDSIVRWGLLSAVAAIAFALVLELGVPHLFGQSLRDDKGWVALAGPAEETGKLLVPAILWFAGRFRLPREGYLLVLVSSCAFGVFESGEYALNPEHWQPSRVVLEIMHPLLTGFVAAVAWQAAWRRSTLLTGAGLGAWLVAMVAHSTNDFVVFDDFAPNVLGFISIVVVVLMYLLQKHSARQLVPPDAVASVSRRWRPAAPASAPPSPSS